MLITLTYSTLTYYTLTRFQQFNIFLCDVCVVMLISSRLCVWTINQSWRYYVINKHSHPQAQVFETSKRSHQHPYRCLELGKVIVSRKLSALYECGCNLLLQSFASVLDLVASPLNSEYYEQIPRGLQTYQIHWVCVLQKFCIRTTFHRFFFYILNMSVPVGIYRSYSDEV